MQNISFLGHLIRSGEKIIIPSTIQRILEAPRPQTKGQVRSFLGLRGYYREFVPNYSHVAIPLCDLMRKGQPTTVKLGHEQETAFAGLGERLANAPILRLPDFEEFVVRTDTSDREKGAVLTQKYSDKLHPVAYASLKQLPRETAYSTIEKVALAFVSGIEKFQSFLSGRRFLVQTNHQPLRFIRVSKSANSYVCHWSIKRQQYSFRIEYIKGRENEGRIT